MNNVYIKKFDNVFLQPYPAAMSAVAETSPASRVDDAYARLKADILSNVLAPGYQAPEPEIAARMGMSRTPVREALIRLQSEGLVELVPRRGARVLPIQVSDMREIYELLTALEPHAAATVAKRKPSADDLAGLATAMAQMENALRADDLLAWAQADDRFHRSLLQLHGNGRLIAFASSLYDQAHRARMVTLRLRTVPQQSTEDHRAILTALADGDPIAAHDLFVAHRTRAAKDLLGILEKLGLTQL